MLHLLRQLQNCPMPFPALVDVTGATQNPSAFVSMFETGVNRYVVYVESISFEQILIAKSTDGGNTWNVMDGANGPLKSNPLMYGSCIDASGKIWVINPSVIDATLQISSFDTVSDTWTFTDNQPTIQCFAIGTYFPVFARGTDLIIAGFIPDNAPNASLFIYSIASHSITLAPIACGPAFSESVSQMVAGSGTDIHLIAWGTFGGNNEIYQQRFTGSNVLGALQTVISEVDLGLGVGYAKAASESGIVKISCQPNFANVGTSFYLEGPSAEIITFSNQEIDAPVGQEITDGNVVSVNGITSVVLTISPSYFTPPFDIIQYIGPSFSGYTPIGVTNFVTRIAASFSDHFSFLLSGSLYYWESNNSVPPSSGGNGTLIGPVYPISLPDPALLCAFSAPIRCKQICVDSGKVMLGSKTIYVKRPS